MIQDTKIKEKPWVTPEIRIGIKERKKLNRLKRNESNIQLRNELEEKYKRKKKEVQSMIKEKITKHEIKKTSEIKSDRNNKLWENIKKLRQKDTLEKNIGIDLHDMTGKKKFE